MRLGHLQRWLHALVLSADSRQKGWATLPERGPARGGSMREHGIGGGIMGPSGGG